MEIYSGYLTVKISGMLQSKSLPNQWCVLYSGRNTLPPVLDVFDQKGGGSDKKKCIELENCHWGKAGTIEPAFCINIKSKSYTFVAQNEQEKSAWVSYLGCLTRELSEQRQVNMPKSHGNSYEGMVMKDNDLYSTTDQIFKFEVVADHNKGDCSAHHLQGLYSLKFDGNSISLLRNGTETIAAMWNYYSIRSYGHSTHNITLNVGKSCSTGEGMFSFLTTDGIQMIDIIQQKTQRLRDRGVDQTKSTQMNSIQASPPATAAKPHVLPKNTQVSTRSTTSAKSANSDSGMAMKHSVKRKPAPLAPFNGNPQAHSEAPSRGPQFIQQLNQSLGIPTSPPPTMENNHKPLSSAASLESVSSVLSKKEKKKQREKEKELKKQEEKAAKERAKKEKEREKALKKEQKKKSKKEESSASTAAVFSEFNEQAHIYAFAEDDYPTVNHAGSGKGEEDTYSDIDLRQRDAVASEAQYAAPWKDLLSSPTAYTPDNDENVYATPQKSGKTDRNQTDFSLGDDYEDCDVQKAPPPEIPIRASLDDEPLNNNIYDHFHVPTKKVENPENVYGMESASAPLASTKNRSQNASSRGQGKQAKTGMDVYETVD